jgi:deazaflavin-dependent oxidoreductase (nitroreductase family)
MSNWNEKIITEFRENKGKVGGHFERTPLLLLHSVGAKSGKARINPVAYIEDEGRLIVIASKGGADSHPDWYFNVKANPSITVEVGTEQFEAKAAITSEPERSELYAKMAARNPGFAEYEKKTSRKIPVIALERNN